ncbi:MAG: hypothetical protein WC801_02920 [Patescibacteria group bacterium]
MNKQCAKCNKTFQITDQDLAFYKKIDVPMPTHCLDCRMINLMCWRNERVFYTNQCAWCRQSVISCFNKKVTFPILCNDCWWSEKFNPLTYGREIDFNKPFFEQLKTLINEAPVGNLFIASSENSKYTNLCVGNKNCYMVTASDYNENAYYLDNCNYNRDVIDLGFSHHNELCYECIDCEYCYNCMYSQNSRHCNYCYFCIDSSGLTNCVGCIGIKNDTYKIFNKQYSQEEYEQKLATLALNTYTGREKFKSEFMEFILKYPRRFASVEQCEDSTGNYLKRSSNCKHSFDLEACENCSYTIFGNNAKDCLDVYGATGNELGYYSCALPENNRIFFSAIIWPGSSDVYYSYLCRTAQHCFGCVSLHNNKYCILNKQYSEHDYKQLKFKLIKHMQKTGEWGEFMPMDISPWAYNETIANDYYPKNKDEISRLNGKWEDTLPGSYHQETLTMDKLPNAIKEVSDVMLEAVLSCMNCSRNFRIIKHELTFYRNLNIPLPRLCSTCRYIIRKKLRNPRQLWQRRCMCTQPDHNHQGRCATEFETTYSPDRKELIYCEDCYQKEIY